jgi:hypothetical protein
MGAWGAGEDVELPVPLFYCTITPMKKWVLRITIAGIVLAAVAVGALFYFLNDIVKGGVETVGPQLTKSKTRLTTATLSPFSGRLELNGLVVGNPEGWKSESAIKVGDIKVALDVRSALSDTVIIESIHLKAPEITYETALTGSNLGKILENIEAAAGADKQGTTSSSTSNKRFRVKDIHIQGAKVHLAALGQQYTIPLADIRLQNVGTDNKAVTAAELSREILVPLLASVTKAAAEAATGVTQQIRDFTKGTNQLDKAATGLKDLLKKK